MMYDRFQVSKNTPEKQKELLPLAESIRGEAVPFNDLKKNRDNCYTNNEKGIREVREHS
jgi:hypothetical protein